MNQWMKALDKKNEIRKVIADSELGDMLEPFDVICGDEYESGYAYLMVDVTEEDDAEFVADCLRELFPDYVIDYDFETGDTQFNIVFDQEAFES